MYKILLLLNIILVPSVQAQITLKECIESGLSNRANIKSAKTEVLIANLEAIESKTKYLPQLSLAYDYQYNPIIPTQIIPVGQFNEVASDETRPVQFGTKWQQSAGVTVYQPLIDVLVQSRIRESRLNESLADVDLQKAETELTFEIAKGYSRVITLGYQVEEAISDTVRSFQSYSIVRSRFNEGKVLKTELNNSLVNHNSNIANYKTAVAALASEKIYLHYLTNVDLERILNEEFIPIPASLYDVDGNDQTRIQFDSIPDFQNLTTQELLINQQIKTERAKFIPTIGFEGFLGAAQFTETFDPFQSDAWFGSSYVGVTVRLPIFSPEKSVNGASRLQTQLQLVNTRKEELTSEKNKDLLQKNIEIQKLREEVSLAENSFLLQNENINLYQERLQNGQLASTELNVQETELQTLSHQLKQLKEQLSRALIERLYITGKLDEQLKTL